MCTIFRDTTKFQRLIILLNFLFLFPYLLISGPPTELSEAEKMVFNAKLERLMSHSDLHPIEVDEIIMTLSDTLKKEVDCPESTELSKVKFKIITKKVKFDRQLDYGSGTANVGINDIGWYQWGFTTQIEDGIKTITACNYIMLDSAIMVQQEADLPYGPIADEGLLYHELLHGQLVIDSIMNNEFYQAKLCNCNFDLSASDIEHEHIHDLEESYLRDLLIEEGVEDPQAHILDPPAQAADDDGKFKIEVADESLLDDKEGLDIRTYFPKGSNVMEGSLGILIEDGKIFITGMLIDKSKRGLVGVIVDPPSVFLFIGLERTLLILPSGSAIPTLTEWALTILGLTLVIFGVLAVKHRMIINS